jgi:hypothetical protein
MSAVDTKADAIEDELRRLYGAQEPLRASPAPDGGAPAESIRAFRRDGAHLEWHLVGTFGEGLALGLRVPRAAADASPPSWALRLLSDLAPQVVAAGQPPAHGAVLEGPIPLGEITLDGLVFLRDPDLGGAPLLLACAVTTDELAAIEAWSADGLLGVLRDPTFGWCSIPGRPSVLADPAARAFVDAGAARDGSSTSQITAARARWLREGILGGFVTFAVDERTADRIRMLLRARVARGKGFAVFGPLDQASDAAVFIPRPAAAWAVRQDPDNPVQGVLEIALTRDAAFELAEKLGRPGSTVEIDALRGLTFAVLP